MELGPYTFEVLLAYAGSLAGLIGIVGASVWQARKVARRLNEVEARRKSASVPLPEAAE